MAADPVTLPRLLSLDDLREALAGRARPLVPRAVPLDEAWGAMAADPVVVPRDLPSADIARLDGWAIASAETIGASPYTPTMVTPRAVRIGDRLPEGCDAVVATDAAEVVCGLLTLETTVEPRAEVTPRGAEARAGSTIDGRRLGSATLALLTAAGVREISVLRPRVRVEACEARFVPVADFLARQIDEAAGAGVVERVGIGEAADLILRVGEDGQSGEGGLEAVATGLAVTGAEETRVALDPTGAVVIGLAPRLDAAFVVARLVVVPLLSHHLDLASPTTATRRLARKIASRVGFAEVALLARDGNGAWEPLALQRLTGTALARAEAFVEIPAGSEGMAAGTPVAATLLQTSQLGWHSP